MPELLLDPGASAITVPPMPVSRSRLERGSPPPTRRKACGACIRAKRRCNLRRPACLRCAHRDIPCVYPRQPGGGAPWCAASKAHDAATSQASTQVAVAYPPPSATGEGALLPAMPALPDTDLLAAWIPEFWFPRQNDEPLAGWDGACSPVLPWSEPVGLEPFAPSEPDDLAAALDAAGGGPSAAVPLGSAALGRFAVHPRTAVTPAVRDTVVRTHLRYALDELTAAPRRLALQNGTPWAHPALYDEDDYPDDDDDGTGTGSTTATPPRCLLQDAQAACGLYVAARAANAVAVLRHVDARAAALAAAPLPAAPRARLAHVHAALVYLLVQLLDGDVAARAAAEPRLPGFEAAVRALAATLPPGGPNNTPRRPLLGPAARDFWADWVWAESARRTCIGAFFFLHAYRLLSGAAVHACADVAGLPLDHLGWTASAPLWDAASAGAFARAWADVDVDGDDRCHVPVTLFQLDDVLARGRRPEDLDVFSRMLLTAMLGIDEVEGWLADRGGTLR